MQSPISVSIIICTRNRAAHLRKTLAHINGLELPPRDACELLIVDNDSSDDTAEVAKACAPDRLPSRYLHVVGRGKGYAYNAGLAAARGHIALFTDDDVRPPRHWIAEMCAPILDGRAHAVAGGVKLAPHLERSWLQPLQLGWLAATADANGTGWGFENDPHLIGANMAFMKEVLAKVPAFDVELGPGALGFGDDTLFSRQLQLAGYGVVAAQNVVVEHHFEASRLTRAGFLQAAQARGRTGAYVAYHWEHRAIPGLGLRLAKSQLALALGRVARSKERAATEGISLWEMNAVWSAHFFRQYLHERKRPRNYEKYGLVKLKHQT